MNTASSSRFEADEPTVYVLRHTDGYDSNTVVMVSTNSDRLTAVIEQDPPTRLDYYVIETWENGEEVSAQVFMEEDWAERTDDTNEDSFA